MRVGARDLKLCNPGGPDYMSYSIPWVLKLLPALQLDTLTILGPVRGYVSYPMMNELISNWQRLERASLHHTNSDMFGFGIVRFFVGIPPILREPQPSNWKYALYSRDGPDSGSSVTVCRSTQSDCPGAVLNSETRETLEQQNNRRKLARFGLTEDQFLTS